MFGDPIVDFFQSYVMSLGLPDAFEALLLPVAAIADIFGGIIYGIALFLAPLFGVPY